MTAETSITLQPRADLAKCDGADLACCDNCTRKLAPVARNQVWSDPIIGTNSNCLIFANIEDYAPLYSAGRIL
jgi:hypothetical protein